MKKTELVFILDKSGSMNGLEKDTIGGFNSMISEQREIEGEVTVSTVLFNNYIDVIHNRIPLGEVPRLTGKEYFCTGSTSLLDALGTSIGRIKRAYLSANIKTRPDNVMFVITTDGHENSSREFNRSFIKKEIEELTEIYNWEFVFLGANIDAIGEASSLGIRKERAVNYRADQRGTDRNWKTLNKTVSCFRESMAIEDDWKDDIEKDFNNK